jgi:acyl carrier protein
VEARAKKMSEISTKSQIRSFIIEKFPLARKRMIGDDLRLLESGIVDSLGVLDVVGFLQRKFNLTIGDDELTPDNFATIQSLVSFVERKQSGAGVSAE